MFNLKDFEKSRDVLSHIAGKSYREDSLQHHLRIRPVSLLDWIEFLKEDLGFFTLIDMTANYRSQGKEVIYHLQNMGTHQRLNLHLFVEESEVIPSVVGFFPNADWMEREQNEKYGLLFDGVKPSLLLQEESLALPQLPYNPNKSEAPYPEESYIWKSYDLLSPVTKGNFEWLICFDPERVVDSKVHIGFHHQGLESILEKKDIFQITHLVDKVNLSSGPTYSLAWVKAIEEIFSIKIPERAQALRIVLLELGRIADHLTVLASVCMETQQEEFKLYLNAREKIYELFEKFTGHRHGLGIAEMGGLKMDLPPGWISEYQIVSDVLNKTLPLIQSSLISQRKFRSALEGGPVDSQSILQWGVNGPAMRAAGLNFDLRKSQPFYFYQDIDFDIPVGINGSAYDRFLIRNEEIFQSVRIVTQVIDNLPLGEVMNDSLDKNYPELKKTFTDLHRSKEWHYSALESPAGEAGFLMKLGKDLRPERIKFKTPSFALAQALPIFVKGLTKEQVPVSLMTLGLSRWEMDR